MHDVQKTLHHRWACFLCFPGHRKRAKAPTQEEYNQVCRLHVLQILLVHLIVPPVLRVQNQLPADTAFSY